MIEPSAMASSSGPIAADFEIDQKAEKRRRNGERQGRRQPMGDRLGERHELERHDPGRHDFERSVLIVGLEDAIGRQQHRKQQRNPQGAGRDALQERLVGSEADRQQHHNGQKEAERRADAAALAEARA